jgi:hypothetical protein
MSDHRQSIASSQYSGKTTSAETATPQSFTKIEKPQSVKPVIDRQLLETSAEQAKKKRRENLATRLAREEGEKSK